MSKDRLGPEEFEKQEDIASVGRAAAESMALLEGHLHERMKVIHAEIFASCGGTGDGTLTPARALVLCVQIAETQSITRGLQSKIRKGETAGRRLGAHLQSEKPPEM